MIRRKSLLLLALFTWVFQAYGQEWKSTGCYCDNVQLQSNFGVENWCSRFDLRFWNLDNTDNFASLQTMNAKFKETEFRPYSLRESCSELFTINGTSGEMIASMELRNNNSGAVYPVFDNFLLDEDNGASEDFDAGVADFQLPSDIPLGGGYQIVVTITHSEFPGYLNEFLSTNALGSNEFNIFKTIINAQPNNETGVDLIPTLQWDDIQDIDKYILVLAKVVDGQDFPSLDSDTGVPQNADYYNPNITENQFELPESEILEPNTEYAFRIYYELEERFIGSHLFQFTTRDVKVNHRSLAFYDQQITTNSNNPNNYLNKGVPVRFKVQIENELSQNLSTLQASISTSTSGVTIIDNTTNFSAVTSGNLAWSADEFEIMVDEAVMNGTELEFEISLNDDFVSGGPWVSTFSFPIAPFSNESILISDSSGGDGDNIPEPGETAIKLFPKINNTSNETLVNTRGILSSTDAFLNITTDEQPYNVLNNIAQPIEPNATNIDPEFPFEFDYPASEALQELNFNLELEARLGDSNGVLIRTQTQFVFNQGEGPPNAPTISLEVLSDSEIQVSWNAIDLAESYQVLSCDEATVYANAIMATTFIVNGLNPDSTYDFVVKTVNQSGISAPSNCEQATTFCGIPWGNVVTLGNDLITAYGIVTIDGEPATEQDKVGVFVNNELRALGDITVTDNVAYTELSIENNGLETFSFRIWDQSECDEIDVALTINANSGDMVGVPPNYLDIEGATGNLGIEDVWNEDAISIFPNPAKTMITISTENSLEIQEVRLYSLTGQQMKTGSLESNTLDLSQLSSGIYWLKFMTNKGVLTKPLIKE